MAFIGLIFVLIILGVLFISFILALVFLGIAIKKKRNSEKAEKVFFTCSIIFILPIVLFVGFIAVRVGTVSVTRYDNSKAILSSKKAKALCEYEDMEEITAEDLQKLEKLLSKTPDLIYYLDVNLNGIIDYGLKRGDYDLVELALKYGAIYDDHRRYDKMAYVNCSLNYYLGGIIGRTITEEDVEIIKSMFQNKVTIDNIDSEFYTSYLGKVCWLVLYNDDKVTDIELEFVKVFVDNGFDEESKLVLAEDLPSNYSFSSEYHFDVVKDDNYYEILSYISEN